MIRIGRLAAAMVLAAGLAVAAPAAPAAAAACPAPDSGVTVIVDFRAFGGGVAVRCAPGDPGSGLQALQGAGFSSADVPRQAGFVCRIDGRPDPCNNAPPDAYWSYWYADRGGSWTYSQQGAASRDPAPGTVEGWAFGAGGRPGVAPPPAPPPPAPPPPAPDPPAPDPPPAPPPGGGEPPPPAAGDPAPGNGDQPGGGGPVSGDRQGAGTPGAPGRAAPDAGSPPAAGPTLSPGPASPTPAGSGAVPGEPAASTATGSGGPAGVAVAVALVSVLVAAGVWNARRRRQVASRGADAPGR